MGGTEFRSVRTRTSLADSYRTRDARGSQDLRRRQPGFMTYRCHRPRGRPARAPDGTITVDDYECASHPLMRPRRLSCPSSCAWRSSKPSTSKKCSPCTAPPSSTRLSMSPHRAPASAPGGWQRFSPLDFTGVTPVGFGDPIPSASLLVDYSRQASRCSRPDQRYAPMATTSPTSPDNSANSSPKSAPQLATRPPRAGA